MKFDLKHLEAFAWVADVGSFRKATEKLNTTQPNISVRISRLLFRAHNIFFSRFKSYGGCAKAEFLYHQSQIDRGVNG